MTRPRIRQLNVHVAIDGAQLPLAKRVWAEFEDSVDLPFQYDRIDFGVCDDCGSAYAEMQVESDAATIRVTPAWLCSPLLHRQLTLLHESLHVAAFVGPLRDMYQRAVALGASHQYRGLHPIAHFLGHYMFEVDAELALARQYPEFAEERAKYYVQLLRDVRSQEQKTGWYSSVKVEDPMRPYFVLGDRLEAELAGLLTRDQQVELSLSNPEKPAREYAAGVETLRRMLSPTFNEYLGLSRWGVSRYEAVLKHILEVQTKAILG